MTSEAKRTIRYYLLLRAVSSFGVAINSATYVIFLTSKGFNLFQVNLVNFIFFATLTVFEVPTGAFADVFGRKASFVISCFLFSTGMFVYYLANSFWWFALAEATAATGSTFASGAFQAWLVDRLRHQGYDGSVGKIFSKEQQVRQAMAIVAAVIGAFVANRDLALPWLIGGCVIGTAGLIAAAFMKEEQFVHRKFSFKLGAASMVDTVRKSGRYAKESGAVRFIVVMGFMQYFAVMAPNMQWQPFFLRFFSDKVYLGILFAAMALAMIAGSALAPWFLAKVKDEKTALSLSQIGIGLGIGATVFCGRFAPALAVFLGHEVARGMFAPMKDAYLNDNIPSEERATLISFESMSHHAGGMVGLLVSGAMAEYLSMRSAWVFAGAALIVSTLILLKNGKHNLKAAR